MSSPIDPFMSPEEAQTTFDRLITSTGLSSSAGSSEKLAKLRSLPASEMEKLIRKEILIRPVWDSDWFVLQDSPTPLEQSRRFAAGIEGVTIGWTANEVVTFKTIWASWSVQDFLDIVGDMIPDKDMVQDIIRVYGIGGSADQALKGFTDLAADSLYTLTPQALSRAQFPISVYRFEQADDFEGTFYHGSSYHCLDNVYLFRLPAVAGDEAPSARKATADAISKNFLDFVYGKQPWEPISTNRQIMHFDGTNSRVKGDSKLFERVSQVVSSEARADLFANAALRMLECMKAKIK